MEMGRRRRVTAFGYPFATAAYLPDCHQSWTSEVRRIALSALACSLILFCLISGALRQATQDAQQPKAIDSEYRKFDDLVSFLRTRNAKQYAISSPKSIDEAQFITIGGIEQWVTIRGWDRDNPCCCSSMAGRVT